MHAQIDRRQVCRARLRLLSIRLHVFSNSPPDVGLIGHIERQHKVVVGSAVARLSWWERWRRCAFESRMALPSRLDNSQPDSSAVPLVLAGTAPRRPLDSDSIR